MRHLGFASSNAVAQVHAITRDVERRVAALADDPAAAGRFPPILALKSTVDSTVTTEAIVDNLLSLPLRRPPSNSLQCALQALLLSFSGH